MSSPRALDSNELATYSKIYLRNSIMRVGGSCARRPRRATQLKSRQPMCSGTTKSHTAQGEKLFWGHHHFKQKGYIPNGSFGSSHFSVSLKDGHFAIAFFQRLSTKLMSPNSVSHQTNHTKNCTEVIKTSSHRNLSIEPITRINSIPTE